MSTLITARSKHSYSYLGNVITYRSKEISNERPNVLIFDVEFDREEKS